MKGDKELKLTFFRGRRGDVISRLPSGKIVVVDRRSRLKPAPQEKWVCRVVEKERVAIAIPLHRIVEKERQVYRRFKCGHLVQVWTEIVEVPEDIEPEPRISEFIEPELCDECKKKCEHKNIRLSMSSFWIAVNCDDCETTVWSMDLNLSDAQSALKSADRALKEIIERFSELKDVAERKLREWKEWIIEYSEKSKEHSRLVEEIRRKKERIVELAGETLKGIGLGFNVDVEKERFEWTIVVKDAPDEVHTVTAWAPIPEEHRDEILQLWDEIWELQRKADELHWWLTENRPVE